MSEDAEQPDGTPAPVQEPDLSNPEPPAPGEQQQVENGVLDKPEAKEEGPQFDAATAISSLRDLVMDLQKQIAETKSKLTDPGHGLALDLEDVKNDIYQLQEAVENIPQPSVSGGIETGYRAIIIKSTTDGDKTFDEWGVSNGTLVKYTGGVEIHSDTLPGALKFDDEFKLAIVVPDSGGKFRYIGPFGAKGADGLSGGGTVTVDYNSGSLGANQTTNCVATYDVYNYGDTPGVDTPLFTNKALTGNGNGWRALNLLLTAATVGWIAINPDTTVDLVFVDESPSSEQDCS